MSEVLKNIIVLIKLEKSNSEICSMMNITRRELYNYLTDLKNIGYNFDRIYKTDGTITYILQTTYKNNHSEVVEINSMEEENNINMLLTSDWHIGNQFTRKDLRDKIPEYCDDKNIHIILNTGDFINGNYGKGNKNESISSQIKTFSKEYTTSDILMFGALGDHDASGLFEEGINIKNYLDNYRHDIITEYNNLYIKIKNEIFCLYHKIPRGAKNPKNARICFIGHSHKYTISKNNDGILEITAPSLSDLVYTMPTLLELNITFKDKNISNMTLRQIAFYKRPEIISEVSHTFSKNKTRYKD